MRTPDAQPTAFARRHLRPLIGGALLAGILLTLSYGSPANASTAAADRGWHDRHRLADLRCTDHAMPARCQARVTGAGPGAMAGDN